MEAIQQDLKILQTQYEHHSKELCNRIYKRQAKIYALQIDLMAEKIALQQHIIEFIQSGGRLNCCFCCENTLNGSFF